MSRALASLAVTLALGCMTACGDKPAPAEAFDADPLRTQTERSGLIIEVIKDGEGESAKEGDSASIVYRVETDAGQVVGSGEARELSLVVGKDKHLVEGLQMGIVGMKPRELRRIIVPPRLGYRGKANTGFPPDADLVFSVELMRLSPSS